VSKHLGEPRVRRVPVRSRGFAWGLGGFLALNVVTVLAIVQGVGHHSADDVISSASDHPAGDATAGHSHGARHTHATASHGAVPKPHLGVYRTRHGTTLSLKPAVALARKQARMPTVFRVSTFNLLGASHTGRGGNHRGFAVGSTRMSYAVSLLRTFDVNVVGFQEMEPVQYSTFNRLTGGGWGSYPGPTLDRGSIRQSIAWRLDTWQLVNASSIAIPYFHGQLIRMPVVLLRNIATNQQVYFANFHNPATTPAHGNNQRWRSVAEAREVALVRNLEATSDFPIIITGDMNERAEYFSRLAGQTDMCAANAVATPTGGCYMPRRMDVDWIFGTPDITFSGYVSDQGAFVRRTTDHPIVVATGTLAPAVLRR
jgi:hypothetical protein